MHGAQTKLKMKTICIYEGAAFVKLFSVPQPPTPGRGDGGGKGEIFV